jgi:hypothetical protein
LSGIYIRDCNSLVVIINNKYSQDLFGRLIQMRKNMSKFRVWLTSCAFTLMGLASASATLPTPAYVDAVSGNNSNAASRCPVTAPCADLNTALSVLPTTGGGSAQVIFLRGGVFGPVVLNHPVSIFGFAPDVQVQIVADPTAPVGCVGAPAGSCSLTNNGFAVEIAAGVTDGVKISHVIMHAGSAGVGALKLTTGGAVQVSNDIFRGNNSATGPIVLLNPNNPVTTQVQVYFSYSDVGFNNSNTSAGAVLVQPQGNTSLKLHFNHVEVHNASYGIRTDGSSLSGPTAVVATVVSESEFFSFNNAAVNAFSTSGTGTVNAVFEAVNVLNASVALKANGPQSFVILTNNTVVGNAIGVQSLNGATILTSVNNTVTGNGPTNNQNVVGGSLTSAPLQ